MSDERDNSPEDLAAIKAVEDKAAALAKKSAEKLRLKEEKAAAAAEKVASGKAKIKAALDAKAAKEKAAKEAAKEKAKAAKGSASEVKAKEQAAEEERLKPIAKEINVRLEKAAKLEDDADDHRLAAAIQLEVAATRCKEAGIKFATWAAENLSQSYETIRKLVAVGKSPNPALALADMRGKNKEANKTLRDKRKAEVEELKAANEGAGYTNSNEDDDAVDLGGARSQKNAVILVGIEALKAAFQELKASDKMAFTQWCATEVGAKLEIGFDPT
ncbi:MAG TPA: hypothetical protein VFE77_03135 [Rhodanobacter sp.]|nr:hypothetical protein [Rhodanobacter sp.]